MVCIITFARSWQALIATRALGKAGVKVVTADTDTCATSFFSLHSKRWFVYPDPAKDEKGFIEKLIQQSIKLKKKYGEEVVILPIHKETYLISKHKKKLGRYAKLCVDDYDKIMSVHNKGSVLDHLKKHNIKHPRTFKIKDMLELYPLVPTLRFPVFVKLTESAASIGILKIDERDELIYKYKEIIDEFNLTPKDYPVIQEGIEGRDYCLTAIANKGTVKAMMTYMNIKSYPYKSGTGVYRKTVKESSIEREGKKLLRGIKWHGVIELDFRMGKDKKPYFIEANPRFWGGLNQSISANVNYPLLAYNIAKDGDCETVTKIDKTMRTENLTTAVMALMDELVKDEDKRKEINKLRKYWKKSFKEDFASNMTQFFMSWGKVNKKNRDIFKEFIERRAFVKDDILDAKDPFVFLGILYPVAMFLRHGKVNKFLLTSENPKK